MSVQTGRPAEFSDESIIEAGQKLIEANRNITGFALRKIVGGGNPNRLKQIWDEHNAKQSITETEPVAELPIEVAQELETVGKALTDKLSALATELNDKAVKASERRVAEVIRAAGDQREQAERELADASQTVDDLEALLTEADSDKSELEKQLAEQKATNQAQAVELAKVTERFQALEKNSKITYDKHVDDLTKATVTIKNLEQEKAELIADRDQLRMELATVKAKADSENESHQEQRKRAAEEIRRTADKLVKIEGERDRAKSDASSVREEVAKLTEQCKRATEDMQRTADKLAKTESELDKAKSDASSAREEAAKLTGQLEAVTNQCTQLMSTIKQPITQEKEPKAKKSAGE